MITKTHDVDEPEEIGIKQIKFTMYIKKTIV